MYHGHSHFAAFVCGLCAGALWASDEPVQQVPPNSYSVIYTGRLFGYYRVPEVQLKDRSEVCSASEIDQDKTPEAFKFKDALDKEDPGNPEQDKDKQATPLRVAVGDNFAPFLLARQMWDGSKLVEKKDYVETPWALKSTVPVHDGSGDIPMDNVGCFLRLMKFDAIVPGKHDFYFGPSRVWELAKFLVTADPRAVDKGLHQTRMLGVNLYLKTKKINAPDAEETDTGTFKVTVAKAPLPWMRSLEIHLDKPLLPGTELCVVDAATAIKAVVNTAPSSTCGKFQIHLKWSCCDSKEYVGTINGLGLLDWDTKYAVAIYGNSRKTVLALSKSFKVTPPFFGYNPARPTLKGISPTSPEVRPWLLKASPGTQAVAVFGVVDPSLTQFTGRFNSIWLEKGQNGIDDRYETDLQVADPAESLKQALEFCENDRDCQPSRKILLAQMPERTAYDLIASLRASGLRYRFDLVITQADTEHGPRNFTLTRELADPAVLVPDPGAFAEPSALDTMHVKAQRVTVTTGTPSTVINRSFPDNVTVTTDWFPAPVNALTKPNPKLQTLAQYLNNKACSAKTSLKEELRECALKQMAAACDADVSILQLRDLFWVDSLVNRQLNDDGLKALLAIIFWKGDYLRCLSVSGDTINALLKRSRELTQEQFYGVYSDDALTKDWALKTFGADEGQEKDSFRIIGGKLVDPKKLYSVATTDFLADGETGYPVLQGAEPPPNTPWSKTRLYLLSDAIHNGSFLKFEKAEDALDNLNGPTPKAAPNDTFSRWLKAEFVGVKTNTKDYEEEQDKSRRGAVWSIDLYKADFSYSMAAHEGLERTIPKQFPGVSAVDLTTQNTSSIAFDYLVRIERDAGDNALYAQSEMNYGFSKKRQAAKVNSLFGDPYSRNQLADFVYNEVGYSRHMHWFVSKHPGGWKFLLPLGFQTQLTPAISLPEGLTGPSTSPAAVFPSPRSFYLEGRPGIRWEGTYPKPSNWSMGPGGSSAAAPKNGKAGNNASTGGSSGAGAQSQTFESYGEFGYQFGPSLLGPQDFVFNDPSRWLTAPVNPANLTGTSCQVENSSVPGQSVVSVANVVNCFAAAASPVPTAKPPALAPYTQPALADIQGGRSHFQHGLYFNYRIDMPLPIKWSEFRTFSNMEVVSELRGDYFFGHGQDSPVDTHFLLDWKHSLNIPIFALFSGKVSLAPTVEMIFYANKISDNLYTSYSTSVSLSYSFDKREGLSLKKVLGYPNPTPALPSLPSR